MIHKPSVVMPSQPDRSPTRPPGSRATGINTSKRNVINRSARKWHRTTSPTTPANSGCRWWWSLHGHFVPTYRWGIHAEGMEHGGFLLQTSSLLMLLLFASAWLFCFCRPVGIRHIPYGHPGAVRCFIGTFLSVSVLMFLLLLPCSTSDCVRAPFTIRCHREISSIGGYYAACATNAPQEV